jgi:hypothetical protein
MGELRISSKLMRMLMVTMEDTKSHVRASLDLSAVITSKKGIRQGDSQACHLFNIEPEKIVGDSNIN